MESPSGLACDVIRNVRRAWIASQMSVFGFILCGGALAWLRRRRGLVARLLLGLEVLQDLFDAIVPGDRFVVEELELGHAAQPDARADLAAQERQGALERLGRLALRLLVAERRVVDARDLQVRRHGDLGQGDEPDPRIVDVARQQLRQLLADGFSDAVGPVGAHVNSPLHDGRPAASQAVAATRSTTNASITSPTLMSLNFSKPMPHSKPDLTSDTSSLKRRSEPILPSWTT